MTHLSRFAFKRATSAKWSYQHHHGWQLGRDRGRGRGGGRGRDTTPLMLGYFWCTKAAGTYWILHCPVLRGGVPRNAAAHDTGTLFTTSCQYGPAWYLQHICLTLKWPICQSFQTHFNTERYYNTFRLYLFAVNMLEGHQPAGGVARYTTSLLRIMLCHMLYVRNHATDRISIIGFLLFLWAN